METNKIDLNPEATEAKRCAEDPVYFYEKYMLVNGKPVVLTDLQKAELREACKAQQEGKELMLLKGRGRFEDGR